MNVGRDRLFSFFSFPSSLFVSVLFILWEGSVEWVMDLGGQVAGFNGAVMPQLTSMLLGLGLGFLFWCISTAAWCSGRVEDGVIMRDTLDRKPACLLALSCLCTLAMFLRVKKRWSRVRPRKECVSRESNAGPIDGNDGFYH